MSSIDNCENNSNSGYDNVNHATASQVSGRAVTLRFQRRTRRILSWIIAFAGLLNLFSALTPAFRGRLHLILYYFPLSVAQGATVLVAIFGAILFLLARALRRGQQVAFFVACFILGFSAIAHLLKGLDFEEAAVDLAIMFALLVNRHCFRAKSDVGSLKYALWAFVVGLGSEIIFGTFGIGVALHFAYRHHHDKFGHTMAYAFRATLGRVVGITSTPLPDRVGDFATPTLAASTFVFLIFGAYMIMRPIIDRRFWHSHEQKNRAFEIVSNYGSGTLDYFALRDDKQYYFYGDALIAYGVFGGVAIVSPDPIGRKTDCIRAWELFLEFASRQGWTIGVMGAHESWLPIYKESGMSSIYMGDEAIVTVQGFNLNGGKFKGLRQAYNRIAKYGYKIEFIDPSQASEETKQQCLEILPKARRGDYERGFSMSLSRFFDPQDKGLLMAIARDSSDKVVALCQFVPAPGMNGYSLDIMRRDPDKRHPNGLIDFVLCSTIFYLKENGFETLSLNFAAWRKLIEDEVAKGYFNKSRRWVLQKLSSTFQIESLYRFNSKYEPNWLPRYVAFEDYEVALPTLFAILRAEAITDVPFIGKLFVPRQYRPKYRRHLQKTA